MSTTTHENTATPARLLMCCRCNRRATIVDLETQRGYCDQDAAETEWGQRVARSEAAKTVDHMPFANAVWIPNFGQPCGAVPDFVVDLAAEILVGRMRR